MTTETTLGNLADAILVLNATPEFVVTPKFIQDMCSNICKELGKYSVQDTGMYNPDDDCTLTNQWSTTFYCGGNRYYILHNFTLKYYTLWRQLPTEIVPKVIREKVDIKTLFTYFRRCVENKAISILELRNK